MGKIEIINTLKSMKANCEEYEWLTEDVVALDSAIKVLESIIHITGAKTISYHNDDKEYEECCKKHICEKIADFLYENNLITFEKYNCNETEKYGEMKGYLTVIDKNKYEHITIK